MVVLNGWGKGFWKGGQLSNREVNASEPLKKYRKEQKSCGKTHLIRCKGGQVQRKPDSWLHAHRYWDGTNLLQALKGNLGEPAGKTSEALGWKERSCETGYKALNKRKLLKPTGSRTVFIVAMKSRIMRDGAKETGYSSERKIKQLH